MDQKTKPYFIIATVWRHWKGAFKNNALLLTVALICYNIAPYFATMLKPAQWKVACDQLTTGGDPWPAFWMISFCVVANLVLNRIAHTALIFAESDVIKDLRDYSLSRLLHKNYTFFKNSNIGGLISKSKRFSSHSENVIDQMSFAVTPALFLVLYLIGYSFVALPNLAFVLLVWVVLFFLSAVFFSTYRMKLELAESCQESITTGYFSNVINSVSYLRLFNRTSDKYAGFQSSTEEEKKKFQQAAMAGEYQMALQGFLVVILEIVVMYQVIHWVQNKTETIGTAVMVQVYITTLTKSMFDFSRSFFQLRKDLTSAHELSEIFDHKKSEDGNETHLLPVNPVALKDNNISMTNICFAFATNQIVIREFSFHFQSGVHYGIVGGSGAGKSTLINLLLGFLPVQKGTIHVGGVLSSEMSKHCLRAHIAHVPQSPDFLNETIRGIITLGKPNATELEIMDAINKSHCGFIFENFPKGLDTEVGERGVKLSGGQAQRLAICAAILKDAPIVIMDEPTSALDAETEQVIQEAIKYAFHGKTLILIAHRLATVALLDEIIVIKDGSFVTSGHHTDLLIQSPYYKHVWDLQTNPDV